MEKDSPESNLVSLQLGKEIAELQKREDRADQLVLFFLAGANFWEKHAKNCAIMSMAHMTYTITHWANSTVTEPLVLRL